MDAGHSRLWLRPSSRDTATGKEPTQLTFNSHIFRQSPFPICMQINQVVVASLALVAQPAASLAFVAAQPTQIVDQELKNLVVVDSILLYLE